MVENFCLFQESQDERSGEPREVTCEPVHNLLTSENMQYFISSEATGQQDFDFVFVDEVKLNLFYREIPNAECGAQVWDLNKLATTTT